MPLSRIAWLTTVAICLITCVLLLLSGYLGYAGVLLAVALSAAINLRYATSCGERQRRAG